MRKITITFDVDEKTMLDSVPGYVDKPESGIEAALLSLLCFALFEKDNNSRNIIVNCVPLIAISEEQLV